MVRDLGSSNGTKVNGIRVRQKWVLPGDELAIARHRFRLEYNVAPDAAPPPPLEDEENIGVSLMEKAGLVRRRPQEPPAGPPGTRPDSNGRRDGPLSDDERVLEWLQDDEEPAE
jgi:adenylate cyclase